MATLKPGARMRSQVDETEVIIIRAPADSLDLRIGGHAAIVFDETPGTGMVLVASDAAAQLGKRYATDDDTLEILVTKGGRGALTLGEIPIGLKQSKPLPSSD